MIYDHSVVELMLIAKGTATDVKINTDLDRLKLY